VPSIACAADTARRTIRAAAQRVVASCRSRFERAAHKEIQASSHNKNRASTTHSSGAALDELDVERFRLKPLSCRRRRLDILVGEQLNEPLKASVVDDLARQQLVAPLARADKLLKQAPMQVLLRCRRRFDACNHIAYRLHRVVGVGVVDDFVVMSLVVVDIVVVGRATAIIDVVVCFLIRLSSPSHIAVAPVVACFALAVQRKTLDRRHAVNVCNLLLGSADARQNPKSPTHRHDDRMTTTIFNVPNICASHRV
jgi:hypothetical protein